MTVQQSMRCPVPHRGSESLGVCELSLIVGVLALQTAHLIPSGVASRETKACTPRPRLLVVISNSSTSRPVRGHTWWRCPVDDRSDLGR
jgi:hypothetical protein